MCEIINDAIIDGINDDGGDPRSKRRWLFSSNWVWRNKKYKATYWKREMNWENRSKKSTKEEMMLTFILPKRRSNEVGFFS